MGEGKSCSPAQSGFLWVRAGCWVVCTRVVGGRGRGRAGQVDGCPEHQVTHMAHRVQHLQQEEQNITRL